MNGLYMIINSYIIDPAAGGSIDWVYEATNTNLTFAFEFRDNRDGNENHF